MNGQTTGDGGGSAPRDRGTRTRWIVAVAAAMMVGVAGCGGGDATPRGPIDISGSSVALSNGTVEAECFTFHMPTQIEYEINPDSQTCQTAIRRAGGDSLSEIIVRAQTGDNDLEYFFSLMEEALAFDGQAPVTTETVTIGGIQSGVARGVNGYGLPYAAYLVPETTGTFVVDGEPITSFLIAGPTGAPEVEDALNEVVASFRVTN